MNKTIQSICIIAFLTLTMVNCRNLTEGTGGHLLIAEEGGHLQNAFFYVDHVDTDKASIAWNQHQSSGSFSASIKKQEDDTYSPLENHFFEDGPYEVAALEPSTNYMFRIQDTHENETDAVVTELYFRTLQEGTGEGSGLLQLLPPNNFTVVGFSTTGVNGLEGPAGGGVVIGPGEELYHAVHVLTWDEVEEPSEGYHFRLKKGINGNYIYTSTVVPWETSKNVSITGCTPGMKVYYQARTLGTTDVSLDSDWSEHQIISCPIP